MGFLFFLTGEILLPSWAANFFQLGSNAAMPDALSVHSVPRPLEPNRGVKLVFYLPINCSFILITSLHRARDILVYINSKSNLFFSIFSSPGLKTGQQCVGCAGTNRFQWTRDTVDALASVRICTKP